jgi:hypothetical protein
MAHHKKRHEVARKELKAQRDAGDRVCTDCPANTKGKFTPKTDGGGHGVLRDFHALQKSANAIEHRKFLMDKIDTEMQALCHACFGAFPKSQMMQTFVNIKSQKTEVRAANHCNEHHARELLHAAERWKKIMKELVEDKLEDLESLHAKGKTGCAYDHCSLEHDKLLELLTVRHGPEAGTRLCCTSFQWDCEPRREDHKMVSKIKNRLVRKKERLRCQVLCQSGCHAHKTWQNLEWNKVGEKFSKKKTQAKWTKFFELKLKRFKGEDKRRPTEEGCQGCMDDEGADHKCPFKDCLSNQKQLFDDSKRHGVNPVIQTVIDQKHGFLTMCQMDHNDITTNKECHNARRCESLEGEEADTTMRRASCHGFKSTLLCGDHKVNKHVPEEDNSDDQGLIITLEDEVDMLFKQGDRT